MSQPHYRYPGLKPFEVGEASLFFGRAQETRDLYNLVMVERIVVLFAKSGMGKTSLLNAGLIPMLGKSDLKPVYVRFNNTSQTLHEQFLQKMEAEGVVFESKNQGKTLWEQLKYAQASKNGRPATPLIIFDQFEEIFTLYTPEQRQHFVREFADVANRKIPETVQAELLRLVQENPEIPDATLAELERQPSVQCIFSIRSDLLHLLNALSPQIPDILRSRYELGPLSEKGAREAIVLPAGLEAAFASPPFRYDETTLAQIYSELSQQGRKNVESFQLQIICQAIEKTVIENATNQQTTKSPITVSPDLYGGAAGIQRLLTDFYTDKIGELPETQRLPARRIVEQELITDTERRRSVDEGDLLKRNATLPLLNQLVEMRLLRKEPRLDSYYYEISHDTLVPPILVKYRERRREEERLEELERQRLEKAERDALLAAERRKRIRALRYTLFAATLAAISIAAMVYAIWQRNIAERDKRRAYANDLAFKSQIALRDGDRTSAFRLAEFAHRYVETDNAQVTRALVEALYYNDHPDSAHRLPWNFNLEGHRNTLRSVAFSPDGKMLATGSEDNTAKVWNLETGEPILTLEGHRNFVASVAFSFDGKKLATGSEDNTVKIWNLENGKLDTTLKGHDASVVSVAFSPDGQRLATGSQDNTAKIWDLKTGTTRTLEGHNDFVTSVGFSPDGQRLATGSQDNTAKIWDLKTGRARTLEGHSDFVTSVAFSPDGKKLATGSHDKTAKIWNPENGKLDHTLEGHNGWVSSVAFSFDGKKLATGSYDNTAKIWDPEAENVTMRLTGHSSPVRSVAFSPDGKTLATGAQDNTAKIWDLTVNEEAAVFKKHGDIVSSVAFSPDGTRLATSSYDKTIKVFDVNNLQETYSFSGHGDTVMSVAFSPDGKKIASGGEDKTAKIWDLQTGKEAMTLKGHGNYVSSVAFSPDEKFLATGSADSTIKVWNLGSGEAVKTLKGHNSAVNSIAFSPDGKTIASGSADNTVIIWDLTSGNIVRTLKGHSNIVMSVAFSPDGKGLATGSQDNTAKIWDLKTGKATMTLEGHAGYWVNSVSFSPDGKKLATASQDWTVKIWDLDSGEPILNLEGHSYSVSSVTFSPDGKRLATGSEDLTAKIWELDAETIVRKLPAAHRLATLTQPQMAAWDLDDLLDIKSDNEQLLRNTKEPWQISAFADHEAEKTGNSLERIRSKSGYARATRLYDYAAENGSDALRKHIARKYNELGFSQLYIPDSKAAEISLRRGLALDPANPDLSANLAHALLLQGKYAEAEKMYLEYKDKPYKGETYKVAFLSALKNLEDQGVTHPDIERIKALLTGE